MTAKMDVIERRDLRLDEADVAAGFFHRHWRPGHVFSRSRELLLWQFHTNPYARKFSSGLTFRAAFRGEELVGALGYVPFAFNWLGRREYGFHMTNWWVHPELRRASLGIGLMEDVRTGMAMSACLSGMNTEYSEAMYEKRGWVVQYNIPRVALVLAPGPFAALTDSAPAEAWPGLRPLSGDREPHDSNLQMEPATVQIRSVRDLAELGRIGWDHAYWQRLAPKSLGPARESAYLQWRYQDLPFFSYCTLLASDAGGPRGILVFRWEQIAESSVRIVRIVDLVADEAATAGLIETAISEARRGGAILIDYFCTSRRQFHAFERFGFMDASEDGCPRYNVPFLFQPVDHSRRRLNCAWWIRDMDMASPPARESFFATKGDNEFDRPNELSLAGGEPPTT